MTPSYFANLLHAFIPIFVAIDVIGVVPVYVGLTHDLLERERREVAGKAVLVAGTVGAVFVLGGKAIFDFLGITVSDFKVAGGVVLLVIALTDLLTHDRRRRSAAKDMAIVPLGMPLIVGPGTLTALIMLVDSRGLLPTSIAFAANLAIAWCVLRAAPRIMAFMGAGGTKAIAKVMSLLLAAIAVMMIRSGVTEFLIATHR